MKWKSANFPARPRLARPLGLWLAAAAMLGAAAAQGDVVPTAQEEAPAARIEQLIAELGSDEYLIRERAERELLRLGFAAFDALGAAERHPDLEIAARARYLARQIQVAWVLPADSPVVKNLMREYAEVSAEDRIGLIKQLASLPDQEGWGALCRIIRYDRSLPISKRAAVALIELDHDQEVWRAEASRVRSVLGASQRAGAAWLRTKAGVDEPPSDLLAQWDQHLARQRQEQSPVPGDEPPGILLTLTRQKFELLDRLGRREEALATVRALIELETGEPENLLQLLDWLTEEKAFGLVDELAERFDAVIGEEVLLLYRLAEAYSMQGDRPRADAAAKRALALNEDRANDHYGAAIDLYRRGLADWAEAEFRRTIAIGPANSHAAVRSAVILSDMLHDGGRELPAAQVLEQLLAEAAKDASIVRVLLDWDQGRDIDTLRSSMEYYFSLHHHAQGQFQEERARLERALAADPTNADVLIAMHRLPQADEEYRRRTKRAIDRSVAQFRQHIEQDPDQAMYYNQLAWLLANTDREVDEAIRLSLRSLELRPSQPAYLDTLAHAYYARQDYENAVKYQSQAVALEPHTRLLSKQLKVFQAALDKSRGESLDESSRQGASP